MKCFRETKQEAVSVVYNLLKKPEKLLKIIAVCTGVSRWGHFLGLCQHSCCWLLPSDSPSMSPGVVGSPLSPVHSQNVHVWISHPGEAKEKNQ